MASRRGGTRATRAQKTATPVRKVARARSAQTYDEGRLDASDPANIELVFGFVGPTGIDLDKVCETLRSQLKALQYEAIEIRLSELITEFLGKPHRFANGYERIKTLQERGTRLREVTGQADIVGRLAIAAVRAARLQRTRDVYKPATRVAYLIRSFKRPEEVDLFRQVYGKAFTLISVYASRVGRLQFLKKVLAPSLGTGKGRSEEYAVELISRDHDEEGRKLGQKVGKTFPLADYFVTSESRPGLERQLKRLVQLTFGNPYISPSRDEQAMFFAKAAALRSLDLSRQVGAAIVTRDGDVVSTGCNEVPKFGGGLYWGEDDVRARDYERGSDSNVDIKRDIVEDAFDRLQRKRMLSRDALRRPSAELADAVIFHRNQATSFPA